MATMAWESGEGVTKVEVYIKFLVKYWLILDSRIHVKISWLTTKSVETEYWTLLVEEWKKVKWENKPKGKKKET